MIGQNKEFVAIFLLECGTGSLLVDSVVALMDSPPVVASGMELCPATVPSTRCPSSFSSTS